MLDKLAAQWILGLRTWSDGTCLEVATNACKGENLLDPASGMLWKIIGNVAYDLLIVAGIITMFVMVIGGLMYITANGSPDKVAKATGTITGGMIGAVISVSAAVIVGFIVGQVGEYSNYNPNAPGPTQGSGIVSSIMGTLYYAVGALSVIMIIYSGLMYMTAGGDEAKIKKAKQSLVWACVGLAVALGAWAITQFVLQNIVG